MRAWVLAIVLGVIVVYSLANEGLPSAEWGLVGYGAIAWIFAIALTVLCVQLEKKSKPEITIQERIDAAEKELKLAEARISESQSRQVDLRSERELVAKFQANNLPDLMKLKMKCGAFMSHFRQKNKLPASELRWQDTPVIQRSSSRKDVVLSPEVQELAMERTIAIFDCLPWSCLMGKMT